MRTRPIKITKGYPSSGKLDLDDRGHTRADAGDTILWQIHNDSGVDRIELIQEKSGYANFWSTRPGRRGANWSGDISRSTPGCAQYIYSITWFAKDGTGPYVHDPKISIKPSPFSNLIFKIILILITAVLGFFAVKFMRKK